MKHKINIAATKKLIKKYKEFDENDFVNNGCVSMRLYSGFSSEQCPLCKSATRLARRYNDKDEYAMCKYCVHSLSGYNLAGCQNDNYYKIMTSENYETLRKHLDARIEYIEKLINEYNEG